MDRVLKRLINLATLMTLCCLSVLPLHAAPVKELNITGKLKQILIGSQAQLKLAAWQNKVFEEEVLVSPRRFLLDVRQGEQGVQASPDLNVIRSFVAFGATAYSDPQDRKIQVQLKVDASCEKCQEALNTLKTSIQLRYERRGFSVFWAAPNEDVLARKNQNVSILEWGASKPEALESGHEDDLMFKITLTQQFKNRSKQRSELVLMEKDDFAVALGRLWIDQLSELGDGKNQVVAQLAPSDELLIEVSGLKDYASFQALRNLIAEQTSALGVLEDRMMARGRAVFALSGQQAKADLVRSKIAAMPFINEKNLQVEIK